MYFYRLISKYIYIYIIFENLPLMQNYVPRICYPYTYYIHSYYYLRQLICYFHFGPNYNYILTKKYKYKIVVISSKYIKLCIQFITHITSIHKDGDGKPSKSPIRRKYPRNNHRQSSQ